jgi:hypothetical protein
LLDDLPEWKQAYMRELTASLDVELILLDALQNDTLITVACNSAPSADSFPWVLAA